MKWGRKDNELQIASQKTENWATQSPLKKTGVITGAEDNGSYVWDEDHTYKDFLHWIDIYFYFKIAWNERTHVVLKKNSQLKNLKA